MDIRKIEQVAETLNCYLAMLTDDELQDLVTGEPAYCFNHATTGLVLEIMGQAMQEDEDCPTDKPLDARFGAYHRAALSVSHELKAYDIPTGDWLFFAIMETVGVSRERIKSEANAEKKAQKENWDKMRGAK